MVRMRRLARAVLWFVAVTALVGGEQLPEAAARTAVASCTRAPATPRDPGKFSTVFTGIAVTSACNAWAVGGFTDGRTRHPVIEHWDGTKWSVQPSAASGIFTAVAALSARDAWAVGTVFGRPLIEQWNGRRWRVARVGYSPRGGGLTGITVLSQSDAWAVGSSRIPGSNGVTRTLTEHWDGTRWRRVASPYDTHAVSNRLTAVTAVAQDNIWAVGWANAIARYVPLIEHWNGRGWHRYRLAGVGAYSQLNGVSAASGHDVWAVGTGENAHGLMVTLTAHWDGAAWHRSPSPSPGYPGHAQLAAVATSSATRAWAVGSFLNPQGGIQTLLEKWNGTAWQQARSPNPGGRVTSNEFNAIATAPGGLTWAAGDYIPRTSSKPTILALVARISYPQNGPLTSLDVFRSPRWQNRKRAAACWPVPQIR